MGWKVVAPWLCHTCISQGGKPDGCSDDADTHPSNSGPLANRVKTFDIEKVRDSMKRVLIVLAISAFSVNARAQTIDPSIVTSTLGVSPEHLSVRAFGQGLVDVKYKIAGCSVSVTAARTGFKNDLVKLLPAMLAKYPWIKNIKVAGGCPVLDIYGKGDYDDAFMSAMFMRDEVDKVAWDKVRPDDLFSRISFGRFE